MLPGIAHRDVGDGHPVASRGAAGTDRLHGAGRAAASVACLAANVLAVVLGLSGCEDKVKRCDASPEVRAEALHQCIATAGANISSSMIRECGWQVESVFCSYVPASDCAESSP